MFLESNFWAQMGPSSEVPKDPFDKPWFLVDLQDKLFRFALKLWDVLELT